MTWAPRRGMSSAVRARSLCHLDQAGCQMAASKPAASASAAAAAATVGSRTVVWSSPGKLRGEMNAR